MFTRTEKIREGRDETADRIVQNHVIYAMTAGAIPVPIADFVAVTAIQNDMLKQLAKASGAAWDDNQGKALASAIIGTSLAKLGASAVKAFPGTGTLAGVAAQVILSGASTWALGAAFQNHFTSGGSFTDINLESLKKQYRSLFQKGKEVARDLKRKASKEDVYGTIEKLKELHDKGAITDKEFESTRKSLLEKIAAGA